MQALMKRTCQFFLVAIAVAVVGQFSSQAAHADDGFVVTGNTCHIPGVDVNGVLKNSLGSNEGTARTRGGGRIVICRAQVKNLSGRAFTSVVVVTVNGKVTTARLTISRSGRANSVVKVP